MNITSLTPFINSVLVKKTATTGQFEMTSGSETHGIGDIISHASIFTINGDNLTNEIIPLLESNSKIVYKVGTGQEIIINGEKHSLVFIGDVLGYTE